ncbi:MAG TPA: bifunctional UDP-N-acetylglucosamine diphosphorylase/glucosamine-1-phosphate N-acetyltransferase GlmU [Stellaceae bacterium]|nr:bifunctional UDP-N-acetylglucosamine diphosphorylase/glucosamine-1-phosphate N-acetyltransferase GlmU [Stellaceae bacterium]
MTPSLAALVLAAGKGTRMNSDLPKVMHKVAGRSMLAHVLDRLATLQPDRVVVVAGPAMPTVEAAAAGHGLAIQETARGTAHAVAAARDALADAAFDTVLVAYGDTPLLGAETLARLVAARREADAAVVVLGMRPDDPSPYGRLLVKPDGSLEAIVEAADATPDQRAIGLVNSGVMAIDGRRLFALIDQIDDHNAKGEFYLTDIVAKARAEGLPCRVVEAPADELVGVNSRADLAAAEAVLQGRLRRAAMAGGATLTEPASVFLSADTVLGRDVTIGPHVIFGPGVVVGDRVEIKGFCHIEGARIAEGAIIGPFARLRPGADLGPDTHIGNFVEIKAARVGAGAKINHLTYIGDAEIGAAANIGAGTITCNYDGFDKHRTVIGAGAFIGSNTALVAPVTVGPGAMIGAGSVITRDVPADALSVSRAVQTDRPTFAARLRAIKQAAKADKPKR